jgi:hypothetical protein
VFRRLGVQPELDRRGFFGYLLVYQALTSSASLRGNVQELIGASRRWKSLEPRSDRVRFPGLERCRSG